MSKQKKVALHNEKDSLDEYSIFNYLQKTPSVLIAVVSAIVAIISGFARMLTKISIRKTLSYWGFPELLFPQGENSSILFSVSLSIAYALALAWMVNTLLGICEGYIPHKKFLVAMRYVRKNCKSTYKKIFKKKEKTDNDEHFLENYSNLERCRKQMKVEVKKYWLLCLVPFTPIFLITITLYSAVVASSRSMSIGATILVFITVHIILFWIMSIVEVRGSIDRKKIKKDCEEWKTEEYINLEALPDNKSIFMKLIGGTQKPITNISIVMTVTSILLSCIVPCITTALWPSNTIAAHKPACTVNINESTYVLIYQDGNTYYLDRAEIDITSTDKEDAKKLIIFTEEQRIVATDDIQITTSVFDSVEKR